MRKIIGNDFSRYKQGVVISGGRNKRTSLYFVTNQQKKVRKYCRF